MVPLATGSTRAPILHHEKGAGQGLVPHPPALWYSPFTVCPYEKTEARLWRAPGLSGVTSQGRLSFKCSAVADLVAAFSFGCGLLRRQLDPDAADSFPAVSDVGIDVHDHLGADGVVAVRAEGQL